VQCNSDIAYRIIAEIIYIVLVIVYIQRMETYNIIIKYNIYVIRYIPIIIQKIGYVQQYPVLSKENKVHSLTYDNPANTIVR